MARSFGLLPNAEGGCPFFDMYKDAMVPVERTSSLPGADLLLIEPRNGRWNGMVTFPSGAENDTLAAPCGAGIWWMDEISTSSDGQATPWEDI